MPNEHAVAMESAPAVTDTTDPSGETVAEITPVTTTGAQRLDAALEILKALEANVSWAARPGVDVSRIDDIVLWYGTGLSGESGRQHQARLQNRLYELRYRSDE